MVKRLSLKLRDWWQHRSWKRKIYDIILYGFALTGVAIIGAWGVFQLGLTNNSGSVDKNYRYLMTVEEMRTARKGSLSIEEANEQWAEQYARLIAFSRFYPTNARLIMHAAHQIDDPMMVQRMIAAAEVYVADNKAYHDLADDITRCFKRSPQQQSPLVVPWMATAEWEALKKALVADQALINEAGRLTGVEPRMIAACLVGEQIRLFNTKREMVKKYLGPMKVLSVQSQFSYGVNGIKEPTARKVESHLKDPTSEFYMGRDYEHLLDFETDDHEMERYNRLVDYRNHLYSYIYTGCILHQTMLQWRRAGYDIAGRPDILFTLFNVGFEASQPKADPVCGGSRIKVGSNTYTFGAIGFDFYYSGELADAFPFWPTRFIDQRQEEITLEQVDALQDGVSDCRRPEKGVEYRTNDSSSINMGTTATELSPLLPLTNPPASTAEPTSSTSTPTQGKATQGHPSDHPPLIPIDSGSTNH